MISSNKLIYSCLVAILIVFLCASFSGDPPNGNTEAPGDSSCSGCHDPPAQNPQEGTLTINGLTDDPLLPNKTYNLRITIKLTAGTSTRAGFQMVVLDGNSSNSPSAGSFSNLGPRVAAATSGNRVYLEHAPEFNFTTDSVCYTADWTAPSSAPDGISFYAIANLANSGGATEDVIITEQLTDRALPVIISDFYLDNLNEKVLISWTTEKEINSDFFEVLRSTDTKNFESIAQIKAAGLSDDLIEYEFLDHNPAFNRPVYYRIKQIDYDGAAFYTNLISTIIYKEQTEQIKIFPNPIKAGECLFVEIVMFDELENVSFEIRDRMGRLVLHSNNAEFAGKLFKGFNKLVLDTSGLPEGSYMGIIRRGHRVFRSGQFVVY